MRALPPIVLRAPGILYGLAVLFFFASISLTLLEIKDTMSYAGSGNPIVRLATLRGLFQASLESLYIAANGVLAHILLGIWHDGRMGRKSGDEQ